MSIFPGLAVWNDFYMRVVGPSRGFDCGVIGQLLYGYAYVAGEDNGRATYQIASQPMLILQLSRNIRAINCVSGFLKRIKFLRIVVKNSHKAQGPCWLCVSVPTSG
jgi:hypothetical protein